VGVSLWNRGVRSGGCENLQRDEEEEICGGNLFATLSAQDNLLLAKGDKTRHKDPCHLTSSEYTAVYLKRGRQGESCEEGGAAGVE
jgi:hypothetical protein